MATAAALSEIRTARDEADIAASAALDARHSAVLRTPERLGRLLEEGGAVLVAVEEKAVVGYAALAVVLDEGTLLNLVVAPQARRRGTARRLLAALLLHARERNLARVLLEVRAGNGAAIALYESAGFTVDGRRRDYYPARSGLPAEDALLMSRQLEDNLARSGNG